MSSPVTFDALLSAESPRRPRHLRQHAIVTTVARTRGERLGLLLLPTLAGLLLGIMAVATGITILSAPARAPLQVVQFHR